MDVKIRSTTILGVRKKGQIAIGGDGQVTFGDMAFKQKAIKVRKFKSEKGIILGGFAGETMEQMKSIDADKLAKIGKGILDLGLGRESNPRRCGIGQGMADR